MEVPQVGLEVSRGQRGSTDLAARLQSAGHSGGHETRRYLGVHVFPLDVIPEVMLVLERHVTVITLLRPLLRVNLDRQFSKYKTH